MKHLLPSTLLILSLVTAGCRKNESGPAGGGRGAGGPVPVNVGEVVRKDMPVEFRAIGNVEALATVAVRPQVGGELIEVHFEEGQDVKKGDLLFTIQPKLYATQLAQAEANLARNRVQAANAAKEAARLAELDKRGAISKEQLDTARAQAEALAATVKADEATVEIARVQLGYTTIESPIAGRTGALQVDAGNLLRAGDEAPLVMVNQLAPIHVSFTIPEQQLPEIRRGMANAKLPVLALNPRDGASLAEGELSFINNQVDQTTGTIQLKATFPNENRALWPGQFVDVAVRVADQPGATVAPAAAVMNGQRGQQVFVVTAQETAELRPITVARTVGQEAVIADGVQPGERVVVNGQSRLIPGAKVVIKPAPAAAPPPDKQLTSASTAGGRP
jgi:membrane fusion protein, multidrug efflux system